MARTIRPRLETLEARNCPAVTITSFAGGEGLRITGDSDWDLVDVVQNDVTDTLTVTTSVIAQPGEVVAQVVNVQQFQSSKIGRITVDLKDGNNVFFYSPEAGTNLTHRIGMSVRTGSGNDSISINLANTTIALSDPAVSNAPAPDGVVVGDPQVPTRPGYESGSTTSSTVEKGFTLILNSGAGNDNVSVDLGHVANGASVSLRGSLGAGDDTLWLTDLCCVSKNAKLSLDIDGGLGNDALYVMLYGRIDGRASVNLRGGQGNDLVQVDATGTLAGTLVVKAWGGDGDDSLTLNSPSNPASTGRLCAHVYGDAGDDQLTMNTGHNGDPGAYLSNCLLNGGDGTDSARISRRTQTLSIEKLTEF